ncbi:MAG: site-2 protease family protein [Gemmatimonadaceae bacterium]
MFGRRFDLFTLFGFRIRVDASWLVLAVLVTWTLAVGFFPRAHPGLSPSLYWTMGVAGALGLFMSIIIHECFHALVARRFDMPMRGITLFIFGGVAEMDAEPPSAKAEFLMAGAGPLASILIGAICLAIAALAVGLITPPVLAVIGYLGTINLVLAVFNLIPGFPLDGGRMLRAALWHHWGSMRRATRVAASIGGGFGFVLIVIAVLRVIEGDLIGGMWWFLIGLFLRGAATASYQQVVVRRALEGEPVRRFMKSDPVTVPRSLTLQSLVDDYVYKHHFKLYPVAEDGRLFGCITTRDLKNVPRESWPYRTVGDVATSCSVANTIGPEVDAMQALTSMRRNGVSRLLVAEGAQLLGILSLRDLLEFLALKVELEDDDSEPTMNT